jgi:hypothetical protein
MPRQPQGQSGRCPGRAHGDGWVSRVRRRRRVCHSAASGPPFRGVTRPGGPDIEGRLAGDSGMVAGEAFFTIGSVLDLNLKVVVATTGVRLGQ